MIIPEDEKKKRGDYDHAPNESVINNQTDKEPPNRSIINNQNSDTKGRSNNWTIIVYPESAPENWRNILQDEHIKFVVSPLHDKDYFEDTGEVKKSHWHVVLIFNSLKSFKQVKDIADKIKSPRPEKVADLEMMIRYLTHEDNPKKHHYSKKDIEVYGNIDINKYFDSKEDKYKLVEDIFRFIKRKKITEFQDLMDEALNNHRSWFRYFCDHSTYVFEAYIRSQRNRYE